MLQAPSSRALDCFKFGCVFAGLSTSAQARLLLSSSSTSYLSGFKSLLPPRKSSSFKKVLSAARSSLAPRHRLRLDPSKYFYFPYALGKQVRTAVQFKNISKSYVAFKFKTTAPKSCYMRPPGGILASRESLIAIVFKFVEQPEINEKIMGLKKVKFKIMSLKVKDGVDYVPELVSSSDMLEC